MTLTLIAAGSKTESAANASPIARDSCCTSKNRRRWPQPQIWKAHQKTRNSEIDQKRHTRFCLRVYVYHKLLGSDRPLVVHEFGTAPFTGRSFPSECSGFESIMAPRNRKGYASEGLCVLPRASPVQMRLFIFTQAS